MPAFVNTRHLQLHALQMKARAEQKGTSPCHGRVTAGGTLPLRSVSAGGRADSGTREPWGWLTVRGPQKSRHVQKNEVLEKKKKNHS